VAAIDQLSFPTPWLASSYEYELQHPQQARYYTLLKPAPDTPLARGWFQRLRDTVFPSPYSRVIGYVGFRLMSNEAHISTIAVHPEWRGRHLGELLLLTAIEEALALGVKVVSLEVRPSNQVAQRLYRKYGFHFTGVNRGYYRDGEDAWLMAVRVEGEAYRARLAELRQMLMARMPSSPADVGQNHRDTI
jgi:ribosomal-protein-alanine N-acetyltransferase